MILHILSITFSQYLIIKCKCIVLSKLFVVFNWVSGFFVKKILLGSKILFLHKIASIQPSERGNMGFMPEDHMSCPFPANHHASIRRFFFTSKICDTCNEELCVGRLERKRCLLIYISGENLIYIHIYDTLEIKEFFCCERTISIVLCMALRHFYAPQKNVTLLFPKVLYAYSTYVHIYCGYFYSSNI